MYNFTNSEFVDMHKLYRFSDGNALEARRLYEECFLNRHIPYARTSSNIHGRLCE